MPVEEITLSTVGKPHRNDEAQITGERGATREAEEIAVLARAYLEAAHARDLFAFTRKGRARRRERFDQAVKTVVKTIASEAARIVHDRPARLEVRTRLYVGVMAFTNAVSIDQQRLLARSRCNLRWSVGLAIVGLLGICGTLISNGVLPRPW
jgi:uncharacterized membrane protein